MSDFSKVLEKFSAVPWRAALFVLGLSFIAASVFSTVIAKVFLPQGKTVPKSSSADTFNVPPPTASLNQAGVDLILKRNLFNSEGAAEEKKADATPEQQSKEAVKSDLPVKLVGTIYGGDPFSGLALVENSQKRTINSFMVGDNLMKDATVKEVHKEKIIIDRAGRLEYIEVERQEIARNSRKKKKAAPAASSASTGLTPIATAPPPDKFHEEGFERDKTEMNMSEPYRQKLLTTDFPKVLQDAKASPKMCEGGLCGFCLTRIRQESIYEKAGLQNDDCVTEINGVPLTDTAQAIKLLQSLRNEKEIEVRLERGGAPMKFNLNIH